MGIEQDRRVLAGELARVASVSIDEVDRAILAHHAAGRADKRNMVSTLSSIAHVTALLESLSQSERDVRLLEPGRDGETRIARLLKGSIPTVCGELAEAHAGPFDVTWDGNWPHSVALVRLRGRIPVGARPGDLLVGSDGEGTRIDIRVVEDEDGVMTGNVLSETWKDPPFEDVWLDTYRRLEKAHPEEVPQIRPR
jgi:hypothetical protein